MPAQHTFLEKFKISGFPSSTNEDWKYTNVKNLNKYLEFYEASPMEERLDLSSVKDLLKKISPLKNYIVIVDGKWLKDQSTFKAVNVTQSANDVGLDASFSELNQAFLKEVLEVNFGKTTKTSLEIVHIATQRSAHNSRVVLRLDRLAEAEVIESFYSAGAGERFFNATTLVDMKDDSRLRYVVLEEAGTQSSIVHSAVAHLKQNSVGHFLNAAHSYVWSRNNISVYLEGQGAEVFLNGLYAPTDSQVIDHCTKIYHRVPQTTSHQLYKGVLAGKSKAIFNGKIKIDKDAQKSATEQLNKNIVLENRSEAIARPQLEIDADDVKATHGATVGKLNEEELFYLESRGIPDAVAKKVLIQGFVREVLDVSIEGDLKSRVEKSLNLESFTHA